MYRFDQTVNVFAVANLGVKSEIACRYRCRLALAPQPAWYCQSQDAPGWPQRLRFTGHSEAR
jgi:hypothetical protein